MNKAIAASKTDAAPAYEDKWRAEEDMRTLTRAAEVKADPKRYKAALALAREQIKALAEVTMKK